MTGPVTLVLVHGVGGPQTVSAWIDPLNRSLSQLGYPALGADDAVIVPDYSSAFGSSLEGDTPALTWERPSDEEYQEARLSYLARRARLAREIGRARLSDPGFGWALVPDKAAGIAGQSLGWVRRYVQESDVRERVWRMVLRDLPARGPVVVVGHSLGSVVVADLLPRLPRGVVVDCFISIGSPLAISALRRHSRPLRKAFPFDRVRGWLNVYDPGDVVTIGRGIASVFPAVLDEPVALRRAHDLTGYMSHPAVAIAVGEAVFMRDTSGAVAPTAPVSRRIGEAWHLPLLQFGYSDQLSRTCRTTSWRFKGRLDLARRIQAERLVAAADRLQAGVRADLGDSPTADDLLFHGSELVDGRWTDQELTVLSVALHLQRPVQDFDLDVDDDHRSVALIALLNRVRQRGSAVSDPEYAAGVVEGVHEARRALKDRDSLPWGPILAGVGLTVLAATGVGILAAVPAGLAGAAAITATLAAFGPGGMVGGIVALATLTGTGSALASLGLAATAAGRGGEGLDDAWVDAATDLAYRPADEVEAALVALLAVVAVQRRLGLLSTAAQVERVLLTMAALVDEHLSLAEAVTPGSAATKDWARKQTLLERALAWLADNLDDASWGALVRGRHDTMLALES